jgi:2-succinyl-5-enolpyruvyl-6-hydroxy-3-cyclohexene-1-carboxylate synthase
MTNIARARAAIEQACRQGVREFCVCSGSRNAPLLAVLGASDLRCFSFVDERSAAFFALGRIKLHGAPVAVVTTSGTAAAELLPALVEAYYSGLPLIPITADRPAAYRGTAAPQTIEQVGLFGVYGERHINVEFDEPLLDEPVQRQARTPVAPQRVVEGQAPSPVLSFRNPIVILGALHERDRPRVKHFVEQLAAPVYAEPLSGLREQLPNALHHERTLHRLQPDAVIRIGNVPTLRFWRDLESMDIPVVHFSRLPFPGLTRGDVHPIEALPEAPRPLDHSTTDHAISKQLDQILAAEPTSELALFRRLSQELPNNARIYLGNSLPIREWDLAATREPKGFELEANRGANGIDGQLSTFFGWCKPGAMNVAIVGDLTALYDLNAPWIVPQLDAQFRIVVINNRGGRIFERVAAPDKRLVLNEHDLRFDKWAEMFGIDVEELRPDLEASRRAWQRYDELWR